MNFIDIILILPIIWFAYAGFKRGLIIELASLLALILGIYAALHFSDFVEEILQNVINMGPRYREIVAFIITFLVVIVVVHLIGKILEKIINLIFLGFLNKMAGGLFGILKGVVILSIILVIINQFDDTFISQEKKEGSIFYKPIASIAPMLWNRLQTHEYFIPPEVEDDRFDKI